MKLAKIALSAATFAIDRPYSYAVPPELEARLEPGMRVLVPFGTGNRPSEGLVLSLEEGKPRGSSRSAPCWTRPRFSAGKGSSWPCGCGSGFSAPCTLPLPPCCPPAFGMC